MPRFLGIGGSPAATSHRRKRNKLLAAFKSLSRNPSPNPLSSTLQPVPSPNPSSSALQPAPSPNPSISVFQQAAPHVPVTSGNNDIWTKAYNKLPDGIRQRLRVNQSGGADKLRTLQDVLQTAIQAKDANMAKRLKLKLGSQELDVQGAADRLVGWITKFKEVGDIAVQYDPVHAALPWAGVRFILLLAIGDQEKLAAAIVGMERIAALIGRFAIYEQLYLTGNVPASAKEGTEILRQELLTLYTAILQALCRSLWVFKGKLVDKLKSPESTLVEMRAIDEPESAVSFAVIAVENCYHSAAREDNKEKLHKLQELLKEFKPVISRIDRNVEGISKDIEGFVPVISMVRRHVDGIYKDIEESKRITILQWFSTVPYQSHHDLACESRVEHTGTWLFKRKEFMGWENSKTPAILWLHGIPGAGKTKLVSATIDYLNGVAQFDKVAFFYCKRDEADRRDREKILHSLIKQLACPPKDFGDRICTDALDAYNKEQKDPSSRHQLNFDSSLNLLGHLIECFERPVVLLDALDECTEEVQAQLLRGLLSVVSKAKCPVKVFISSRHSLDIETRLRNLPHVCIEARDNAEDIENYVRRELNSAIQEERLLRGKVSKELRECVEKVILKDSNGMFLWVDWQLRELCKLMRESDIRARLGKLPKGLTGVYDEIITSIKSQPECNCDLAIRALKWMLVSERPLQPEELVVAAELNPSISVAGSAPAQQTALPVELLVQSCGGLLLLDTTSDVPVVRFSHLSVQEYLETQNEAWHIGVIDAQLFVSESCLWTLQCGHSLNSSLYKYAAFNWFKHCRSYQDLVLSTLNTKDTTQKPQIPLLDRFLGSFHQASANYAHWANRLHDRISGYDALRPIRSTPPCPAFLAAFAGLGELVSWLWRAEGNDMKIKNDHGDSLLDIACQYGGAWIVAEVLTGGFEINDLRYPLHLASRVGNFSMVKLLLDQGADANLTGDVYDTLGAAASSGSLEIVSLLLDRGADVNLTCGSSLASGALNGHLEMVTLLLDRAADVNVTSGDYGTALGAAVSSGSPEVASLLLDRGADVNLPSDEYGSVLASAAFNGHLEIVTLLLDRGGDVNLIAGEHGCALASAAFKGNSEIVTLLLDRGADVNLTGGDYGTTLGAAAHNGRLEVVSLLLGRGADVNLTSGKYGSALASAAFNGHLEIVTLLLDRGGDVNLIAGEHGCALASAAFQGNPATVILLLDRGADVNATGGVCGTALSAASFGGQLEIVALLLDRGADVNLTGGIYGTALGAVASGSQGLLEIAILCLPQSDKVVHMLRDFLFSPEYPAMVNQQRQIVRLLLVRGADINITFGGKYGTALGVAAYHGEVEMVKLLLEHGANPGLRDIQGIRPRDLAEQQGGLDIVELLDSMCVEIKS